MITEVEESANSTTELDAPICPLSINQFNRHVLPCHGGDCAWYDSKWELCYIAVIGELAFKQLTDANGDDDRCRHLKVEYLGIREGCAGEQYNCVHCHSTITLHLKEAKEGE